MPIFFSSMVEFATSPFKRRQEESLVGLQQVPIERDREMRFLPNSLWRKSKMPKDHSSGAKAHVYFQLLTARDPRGTPVVPFQNMTFTTGC